MAAAGLKATQVVGPPRQISSNPLNTSTPQQMEQKRSRPVLQQKAERNVVSWTLSGKYSRKQKILIDAQNEDRFISLEMAIDMVASLTGAFAQDSTVCLHLSNDILYPILCLAIWSSRCRWTGTNASYKEPEIEHHLRTSSAKYIITSKHHLDVVERSVEKSGTLAEVILFCDVVQHSVKCSQSDEDKHKWRCLHDLLQNQCEQDLWDAVKEIQPDSIATLASTSGTTGAPKMAARTHRAIVLESEAMTDRPSGKSYEVRRLFCVPIFHAFAFPDMVINALRLGVPSYFSSRFVVDDFSDKVKRFSITETFAPPAMILKLADAPACAEKIKSLRTVFTGGAPFTDELRVKFGRLFASSGSPPVIAPVWGMTEAGWITTLKWCERQVTSSVGRCPAGYQLAYGKAFKSGDGQQLWELLVRSESIMTGYWGNEQATIEAFDRGWLKTGDVGYVKDGMVFLVDRIKDLIKVNSFQVSPTELGDTLLKSRHVKDAAVVGAWRNHEKEHPVAFVVRADSSLDVSAAEIKQHMLDRLAKYKASTCIVCFIDQIPRNPTGKIDRNILTTLADAL